MAKNFSRAARGGVAAVMDPVGRVLARAGVSANAITVIGCAGVLVGCFGFVTRGELLAGTVIVTLSVMTDMLDGAVARASGGASKFGAFLDSTMDRIADGAVFGSLAWWLASADQHASAAAALICLVAAQVISYAKARAEGLGIRCDVGFAERGERLVGVGLGAVLEVAGVPHALAAALWLLAGLTVFTVAQRVAHVRRELRDSSSGLGAGGDAELRANPSAPGPGAGGDAERPSGVENQQGAGE